MKLFVHDIKPYELHACFDAFQYKQEDNSENIMYNNLLHALMESNYDITPIKEALQRFCKLFNFSLDEAFQRFDTKGHNGLDLEEFDVMLQQLGFKFMMEELLEAFSVFDLDKSGKLNKEEFKRSIFEDKISKKVDLRIMNYMPRYDRQLATETAL